MNESTATWATGRELVSVALAPQHLKRTVSVSLIVGTTFFAMNQLSIILAGHATARRPDDPGGAALTQNNRAQREMARADMIPKAPTRPATHPTKEGTTT